MMKNWMKRITMFGMLVCLLASTTGCGKDLTNSTRQALSSAATTMFNAMLQNSMYPNR